MIDGSANDCPLPATLQTRNLACFAGLWCLIYLTGPISYVGVTHANLLHELENNDRTNNSPQAWYQWMSAASVLVAWLLPHPRWLKPLLIGALAAKALVTALVVAAIWFKLSGAVVTTSVIAFGGVFGAANAVQIMTLWELVRRGVATGRRGTLMGWTFGLGPVMACVGSLLQQLLLSAEPITGYSFGVAFPENYMLLFAGAIPVLLASIVLSVAFVVPPPVGESIPAAGLADILGGLRQFLTTGPVLICAIAYVMVYSGGRAIMDNVSLHAKDVLGDESNTVGVQNFLRFGFKAVAGVLLGYLLAKTHPKATLLATIGLLLLGMAWALTVPGWWYLLTVGWLGAGELFGAYFFNYISTASPKSQVRVNIAYVSLMGIVVGFASVMYGQISDNYGRIASFHVASCILVFTLLVVVLALPARPTPRDM
ncbi:MAG: hypothetical protein EXR98_15740 [Gemmataceae bacterium]|nr:hypothetical protein [Gemmataceae bacterium]